MKLNALYIIAQICFLSAICIITTFTLAGEIETRSTVACGLLLGFITCLLVHLVIRIEKTL